MRQDKLLDHFVVACLIVVTAMTPWAMGGVLEIWQFVLFIPLGLATVASVFLFATTRQSTCTIPAVAWPLLIGVVLAAISLIPLSPGVLARLSPRAHEIWSHVDKDMAPFTTVLEQASSSGTKPNSAVYSVSLARGETRYRIGFLLFAAAALLLANRHLRDPGKQRLFFTVTAINGALLTLFGIVQSLTFNGRLFWILPLEQGGHPFSAFVNRNNAAGYLCMCLGATMALLIMRRWSKDPDAPVDLDDRVAAGMKAQSIDLTTWGWSLVVVLLTAGVFSSLSRGGALSLIIAAVVTAWYTRRSHRGRSARMAMAAALVLGLVFAAWLGRGAILKDRVVQSFSAVELAREGRLHNWQDALACAWEFLPLGSGLGTYRYVYLLHEESLTAPWFEHAENQYLETAVELGAPGLFLVLVAIWLLLRSIGPWLQKDQPPIVFAVGTAGLFVVVSQLVHASFDFGFLIPSNLFLFALWCGLLSNNPVGARQRYTKTGRAVSQIVLLSLVVGLAWSGWEVFQRGQSLHKIRASLKIDDQEAVDVELLRRHIASLEKQLANRPGDPQLQYYLARLHILEFRRATYDALTDRIGSSDQRLWQLTSLVELHARWNQLAAAGQSDRLMQLREDRQVRRHLVPAAQKLTRSLRGMPLRPQAYLALAEIGGLFVDPETANALIGQAKTLTPADARILFRAGLLELQAGQTQNAIRSWRHCLDGTNQNNRAIILIAKEQLSATSFSQLLPDDPLRVIQIAKVEFSREEDRSIRRRLAEISKQRLNSLADDDGTESEIDGYRRYLTGAIHALLDDPVAAAAEYRAALQRQPQQTAWRSELVNALIRQQRFDEALAEARICEKQDPRQMRYRLQIQQIEKKKAQ